MDEDRPPTEHISWSQRSMALLEKVPVFVWWLLLSAFLFWLFTSLPPEFVRAIGAFFRLFKLLG